VRHRERHVDRRRQRVLLGTVRHPCRSGSPYADADAIAKDPFDVDAIVESTWQPLVVAANAQVLRAADESAGGLFDALA
jgi:hypothetical protein